MKSPPGPFAPRLVQVARWLRDPTGLLDECGARYGDIFTLYGPHGPHVMLTDPEAIRQVYAATYDQLAVRRDQALVRLLGDSVLSLDGPAHHRRRRLVLPALHRELLHSQTRSVRELTWAALASWPLGTAFKLRPAMQALTMQIILRTLVGLRAPARLAEATRILSALLRILGSPQILIPLAVQERLGRHGALHRLLRLRAEFDRQVDAELAERRAAGAPSHGDVLSLLMTARDEDGQPPSDTELRDELASLVAAGYDTTANSLSWVLSRLLAEPALLARLQDELTGAHAEEAATHAAGAALLEATVRETLRLHPVFPYVYRTLRAPQRILGYDLPAGTAVAPCAYLVHRRPDIYPQPLRFWPERFVQLRPSPAEWMPFGGGLHRCIGSAMALWQLQVVLTTILSSARLRRVPGPPPRAALCFFSLVPSDDVPAVLCERRPLPAAATDTMRRAG